MRRSLDELWRRVGLSEVETDHLRVESSYTGFEELWEPFTFGVGPAGAYLGTLSREQREELRAASRVSASPRARSR